jgi:hypothetical protein
VFGFCSWYNGSLQSQTSEVSAEGSRQKTVDKNAGDEGVRLVEALIRLAKALVLIAWVITSLNLPHQFLSTADCSPPLTLGPADGHILQEEEKPVETILSTTIIAESEEGGDSAIEASVGIRVQGSHNVPAEKHKRFGAQPRCDESQTSGELAEGSRRKTVDLNAGDESIVWLRR